MPVTILPLDPDARARVLLRQLLEDGDVVGRYGAGRTVIQLTVGDRLLEELMTFDAGVDDLEEDEDEADEAPVELSLDRFPPRRIYRGRP